MEAAEVKDLIDEATARGHATGIEGGETGEVVAVVELRRQAAAEQERLA